jgi:hypothetical protein
MDPLTAALNLVTEMYKAFNGQNQATKDAQGAAWQVVFDDVQTFFAKVGVQLPRLVVYIAPPAVPPVKLT